MKVKHAMFDFNEQVYHAQQHHRGHSCPPGMHPWPEGHLGKPDTDGYVTSPSGRICPVHDKDWVVIDPRDNTAMVYNPVEFKAWYKPLHEAWRWVDAREDLPEFEGRSYLVRFEHRLTGTDRALETFDVAVWGGGRFVSAELNACRRVNAEGTVVTHWMPIKGPEFTSENPQGEPEGKGS